MYDGYNKIFWGMIISSFNINLGPINILPDFLGFLLILSGLNTLNRESSFEGFENITALPMLLAILSFIGGAVEYFMAGDAGYSFINILWTIGFITTEFIFFFKLLEVSIEYLKINKYHAIEEEYILKLRNYTALTLIYIVSFGISLILNLEGYIAIIAILAFILRIYLLITVYGLRNIFKETKPSVDYGSGEF